MTKNIKPGFLLKITTWENDADNYNTKELSGLSEDHTKFYIEVAKLFYSCHGSKDTSFGNADRSGWDDKTPIEVEVVERPQYYREDDKLLPLAIKKIVDKYRVQGLSIPENWDYSIADEYHDPAKLKTRSDYLDYYSDLIYDLIGSWADGEYWRVFEDFEVYHVPGDIENVTSKFS